VVIYKEYIESDEWKNKKRKSIQYHWYRCCKCKKTWFLEVHHWCYDNLGNEDMKELFAFCESCHKKFHNKYWVSKNMLFDTLKFIKDKYVHKKKKKTKKQIRELKASQKKINKRNDKTHKWEKI